METTEWIWKKWKKEHLWSEACWIWDLENAVTPLGALFQDKWKGCRRLKLTIGTQDKAKEEEDNKTHNFPLNLSIVSLLLNSKSDLYKGNIFIYSL